MTTRTNIQELIKELYDVEVSPALISEIAADLDAEVAAWQTRKLDAVYAVAYFDGLVVHVRGENGRVSQHTIYVALGVNLEGRKELLGLVAGARTRATQILARVPDRFEKPRSGRHLHRLH